jgi:hypothetical protein
MTLTDLVPSLEVCQQLKVAGFPQDTAMVWANKHDFDDDTDPFTFNVADWIVVERIGMLDDDGDPMNEFVAAPTAEGILRELPPYLRGSCVQLDLNVSHVVGCNFDGVQQEPLWIVQWCCPEIDEVVGRQESRSFLVLAASAAYFWWKGEKP